MEGQCSTWIVKYNHLLYQLIYLHADGLVHMCVVCEFIWVEIIGGWTIDCISMVGHYVHMLACNFNLWIKVPWIHNHGTLTVST